MDCARSLIQKASLTSIATASHYLKGYALVPILAKSLTQGDYGLWVQIIAIVELLASVGSLSLGRSLIRFWPPSGQERAGAKQISTVLMATAFSGALIGIIVFIFSYHIARTFLGQSENVHFVYLVILLVPASIFSQIALVALRAQGRLHSFSYLTIFDAALTVLCATAMALYDVSLTKFLISLAVLRYCVFIIAYFISAKDVGFATPNLDILRKFLRFSLPLLPTASLLWVINVSDRLFISYFNSIEDVAAYSLQYSIGSLIGVVFSPIFLVLIPEMNRMWKNGEQERLSMIISLFREYGFLISLPLIVLSFAHTEEILALISNAGYTATPLIVGLVGCGILIFSISCVYENVACLTQDTSRITVAYSIAAASNAVLNVLFIPIMGMVGAAITTCISFVVMFFLTRRLADETLLKKMGWGARVRIGLATVIMLSYTVLHEVALPWSIVNPLALYVLLHLLFFMSKKTYNQK